MSQRFGLSRVELDAFALESHRRAIAAWEEGRFDAEVAPVGGVGGGTANAMLIERV